MENKLPCEVVRDLLPAYIDGLCSRESAALIDGHLTECQSCRREAEILKDTSLVSVVEAERNGIIARHAKRERSRAWTAGTVIAGILLIPVLITAIVVMAGGTGAGELLVLAASMILVAALTVVPLLSKKNRLGRAVAGAIAAIVLIEFFTIHFFGEGSFLQTAVPTVFGLTLAFFPLIILGAELPEILAGKKALITLGWDTLWYYLTVAAVTLPGNREGFREGVIVGTIFVIFVWAVFGITQIPRERMNRPMKAGLIVFLSGFFFAFVDDIGSLLLNGVLSIRILSANLRDWGSVEHVNGNISLLSLVAAMLVGGALFVVGCRRRNKDKG